MQADVAANTCTLYRRGSKDLTSASCRARRVRRSVLHAALAFDRGPIMVNCLWHCAEEGNWGMIS